VRKPRTILAQPEDKRFAETFFVVEATSFEKFCIWKEWHEQVIWEDEMRGCIGQIGTLARRPVTLSVFWARIEGRLVAFYESPSQVTDSIMVEKWLGLNCAPLKWDNGTRNARCDAQNFHLCIAAIREANEREPVAKAS
jgi:hypothetical protein